MDPNERYYFPVVGYNYRMTNIACAIGCAQLERREEILQTRNQVYEWYRTHLPETDAFSLQPVAEWAEPTPWMFSLTLDPEQAGGSRDELRDHLDEHGIETRPFFIPVHTLPPYEKEARAQQPEVPTGERLSKTGINLPTHADIREHDVERICRRIEIFLNDGEA
jgi:perosamine synthetase